MLLGGQHRRFRLVQVVHGLDEDTVRPCLGAGLHHLGEGVQSLLKGQVPQRGQQLSRGADVQGHEGLFPALGHRLPGQGHPGLDQCLGGDPQLLLFQGVGPKGVGVDHLGPGLQVRGVDLAHRLGALQVPKLGGVAGGQAHFLKLGAGGAVEKDKAVSKLDLTHGGEHSFSRKGQFWASQLMQRPTWHWVGSDVRPITPVMDLVGTMRYPSVKETPSRLGICKASKKKAWACREKSP